MGPLRQIMYGVTDFALMRRENAYFVDRTALIRELEMTRYAMFLRPRRFGKSLLCSILQAYYDTDYAERFDELFGGLEIGRDPTPEHGKYLVLNFNFTGVEKVFERVVQTALCSLLYVGHGPYIVRHEQEAGGGFVDIAFEPQLGRWPQIGHAALVELKYLKTTDDASPAALAKIKAAALDQMNCYAADHDLAREWCLADPKTKQSEDQTNQQFPSVVLHRIVLVFHGGDVALSEEVAS